MDLQEKTFSVIITGIYFSLPSPAVSLLFALRTVNESQLIFILSLSLLRIICIIPTITPSQQIMEKCRQSDQFQNYSSLLSSLIYFSLFLVHISLSQECIRAACPYLPHIWRDKELCLVLEAGSSYRCFVVFWRLNLALIVRPGKSFTI